MVATDKLFVGKIPEIYDRPPQDFSRQMRCEYGLNVLQPDANKLQRRESWEQKRCKL